jgi:hypothetical protein
MSRFGRVSPARTPKRRRRLVSIRLFTGLLLGFALFLLLLSLQVARTIQPLAPSTGSLQRPTYWNAIWKDTKDPCVRDSRKYRGILLIQQGDAEGATATIFFLFVLNQLLYAQKHSLLPWIHLHNASHWVYDPRVHGGDAPSANVVLYQHLWDPTLPAGLNVTDGCPPVAPDPIVALRPVRIALHGTGVWDSYFTPVSPLTAAAVLAHSSCHSLPLIRLTPDQLLHGLHLRCPWSVRAWRYGGTPVQIQEPHTTLHKWLGVNRRRAAPLVRDYYRLQPDMQAAVDSLWNPTRSTLGLHIRHSDKANRRKRIPVASFRPYVERFLQQVPTGLIYLATDSERVIEDIQQTWPSSLADRLRMQPSAYRSRNASAVFSLFEAHHDATNRQVLVDIVALSRCTFLIHGLSAVSEAAIYWNIDLHERSVNLEDKPRHVPTPDDFGRMVEASLSATNFPTPSA